MVYSYNKQQIFIWVRNHLNLPSVQVHGKNECEFCQSYEIIILDKSSYSDILGKFGLPKSTITNSLNVISLPLNFYSLKHLCNIMGVGKITKIIVREVIETTFVKKNVKTITFSSTKKHILWQHHKYMVHMDSQEI